MGSVKLTIGEKKRDKWLANADVLSCGFEQEKGYEYFNVKCHVCTQFTLLGFLSSITYPYPLLCFSWHVIEEVFS